MHFRFRACGIPPTESQVRSRSCAILTRQEAEDDFRRNEPVRLPHHAKARSWHGMCGPIAVRWRDVCGTPSLASEMGGPFLKPFIKIEAGGTLQDFMWVNAEIDCSDECGGSRWISE